MRGRIVALTMLMVFMASLIAGLLLADSARRYREATERQLLGAARSLSMVLDAEVGKSEALLRTLASSNDFEAEDFAALDAQARRILPPSNAHWIVIEDSEGRQVLNTLRPRGAPLPTEGAATHGPRWAALQRTGRHVSGLRRGLAYSGPVIHIDIMATSLSGRRYDIALVQTPKAYSDILGRQSLPQKWYGGVLDRSGLILARNVEPEKYVGERAAGLTLRRMQQGLTGVFESVALDGVKTLAAYQRSELTGWTVAVAMPRAEAAGYLSRAIWLLALACLALLLVGGVSGLWLARSAARSVEVVVEAARRIGEGQPSEAAVNTGLVEMDQIAEALHEANRQLRAREGELQALNETLEQRVEESAAKLVQAQKVDTLGQLTGGVAHDFNNLLAPILGGLDRLQRRGLTDERAQRTIAMALEAAERAKTLVQRLLAFARRQPLQPTAVDVPAAVKAMTDLIASTLGPQIEIVVHAPPGLPPAKADSNQLELALLNLAVNARDAMPEGGTLSIVAAEVDADGDLLPGRYVRITIGDTGHGMSQAVLGRAVEPFFSTKGVGQGTGLGLSMAHGLAAQLGGTLRLRSREGEGTTVELWLPVADEAPAPRKAPLPRPAGAARGSVLLVEDEPLVRASTAAMLADLGYAVVEAGNADEALKVLESGVEIHLILTDHLMGGMTGADLAHAVQVRWPAVRVLIISGYADVDAIAPDLPRLIKPFRQAELAEALAALAEDRIAAEQS